MRNEPVEDTLGMENVVDIARKFADEIFAVKLFKANRTSDLVRALGECGREGQG